MATEFILKVRNPELKDQLEEIVGVINTLEDGVADLEGEVAHLEADSATEGSIAYDIKQSSDALKGVGYTEGTLKAHEDRLDTLEGDDTVVGSVAKTVKDAVADLAGAGRTTETVKGNADAIAQIQDNKVTAFQETPDDTHYPSEKLVDDSLEALKGVGYTEGTLKSHEDRLDTLEAGVEAVAVSGAPTAPAASTGTLSIATQPAVADTITISQGDVTEVYTFVEAAEDVEGDFDVVLGADVEATQVALAAAINDHSALVSAGVFAANASTITAKVKGVIGDTIATVTDLTDDTDGFSAENLSGGVDGTAGLDGQIRYAADKIYVSVGVSTTAVSNWKYAALS